MAQVQPQAVIYPAATAMVVDPQMQAAAQRPAGEWRFGFFDCFSDMTTCASSLLFIKIQLSTLTHY